MNSLSSNVIIKHLNKWGGDYYLTQDLIFTPNIRSAAHWTIISRNNKVTILLEGLETSSLQQLYADENSVELREANLDYAGCSFTLEGVLLHDSAIRFRTEMGALCWSVNLTNKKPQLANDIINGFNDEHSIFYLIDPEIEREDLDRSVSTMINPTNLVTRGINFLERYQKIIFLMLIMVIFVLLAMISSPNF
jgi:hypothetical protein